MPRAGFEYFGYEVGSLSLLNAKQFSLILIDVHRLRQEAGLRTERGMKLQAEGVMFPFESCKLQGESLAISKGKVWYEVWIDTNGEEGSLHDIESGIIAILYGDGLTERMYRSSTRGIVASLVETLDETMYLSHKLCVRVNVVKEPESIYKVTDWKPISIDQVCCIS